MYISNEDKRRFLEVLRSDNDIEKDKIHKTLSFKLIRSLITNSIPTKEVNKILEKCLQITDEQKAVVTKQAFKRASKKKAKSCTFCGVTEKLEMHHIKPICNYPELKYDLDNIMIVCSECHDLIHNRAKKNFYDAYFYQKNFTQKRQETIMMCGK